MSREAKHQSDELWAFIEWWLPESPARVLDVGCGRGDSTRRLRRLGYDAIGVDPDAPAERGFVQTTLESFRDPHSYDGALAIRSLHHLADVDAGAESLARALRNDARLILFEFAVESVDEAARAWLGSRGLPDPIEKNHIHEVVPLGVLRQVLEDRFRVLAEEPTSYLACEAGRPEHEEAERRAIAAGELRPAGMRVAYARR
jgi:SAM-dependent methyltransferase